MKKAGIILLAIGFAFVLFGCNKSKWKKPTELGFTVNLNTTEIMNGTLVFSGGQILFESVHFDGQRIQGDDVYFESEFENGLLVDLNSSQVNSQLKFDVPQGTYTAARIDFITEGIGGQQNRIIGNYTNTSGTVLPVIVEVEIIEFYDKLAKTPQGEVEIDLVEGVPATAKVTFDPSYWFQTISMSQMDDAQLTEVAGVQTLLISPNVNTDIYDILVERIGSNVQIIIE